VGAVFEGSVSTQQCAAHAGTSAGAGHGRLAQWLLAVRNRLIARGLDGVGRSRARQREAAPGVHRRATSAIHVPGPDRSAMSVRTVEERHHFTSIWTSRCRRCRTRR